MRAIGILSALVLLAPAAFAAQPYVTDDAKILEPGQCQLEFGKQVNRGNNEIWLLPACNLLANIELTIGKSRFSEAEGQRHLYVVQGKGVWREVSGERFGVGWVVGAHGHGRTEEDSRRVSNYYGSLLVSRAFLGERLAAHVNLGFLSQRDLGQDSATWAAAAEYSLNPRLILIGEFSGDDRARPMHQAGIRVALAPERFELDVTAGGQNGNRSETRFWTVGVRYFTDPPPK